MSTQMHRLHLLVLLSLFLGVLVGVMVLQLPGDAALAAPQREPASPVTIHPQIISSFTVPGDRASGLAWGDGHLWLADVSKNVYQLGQDGAIQASYPVTVSEISDLAWYEQSLWAHDGRQVYQFDAIGNIVGTLNVGYWWNSGMEWVDDALYINNYNSSTVHKHDRQGNHLLSWEPASYFHPEDMAYDGLGLWIVNECSLKRFSLSGDLQETLDLTTIASCEYQTEVAITWDGRYLWYAADFMVYQLDIVGLFADSGINTWPPVVNSKAAWGDYDNDGDLDLLLTGLANSTPLTKIFRNDGATGFTDAAVALAQVHRGSAAWGDYNRDGYLDLLLTGCADSACNSGVTRLYQNNQNGTFTHIPTGLPGVFGGAAVWGDYDNDGDLDILLMGATNASGGITKVYQHDGNGVFVDSATALSALYAGAVAWGDYDNDTDLDIVVTGCYTATCSATEVAIYRNDGAGVFTQVFTGAGARNSAIAWGDYDNDGDLDLLVTGSVGWAAFEKCVTEIYQNNGQDSFININAVLSGACYSSAQWGDYDNDGDVDILLTGSTGRFVGTNMAKVYRNDGGGEFTDIAASLRDISNGAAIWVDYDNDRDLDIFLADANVTKLYRNDTTVVNSAPAAPDELTAPVNGTTVTLTWSAAHDQQTPANGLTYNLRVGTTPGGAQTMSAMALPATGYRQLPQTGNVQQGTMAKLSGLTPGATYYWSVQAIDTAYIGSPFATEGTFIVPVDQPVETATPAPTVTPTGMAAPKLFLPVIANFPTPTPLPTPIPQPTPTTPPANGATWSGTTSHGYEVTFTTTTNNGEWRDFAIESAFDAPSCGSAGTFTLTLFGPDAITDKKFGTSIPGYAFSGRLDDATHASGTYSFDRYKLILGLSGPPYQCTYYFTQSGTWTATKE